MPLKFSVLFLAAACVCAQARAQSATQTPDAPTPAPDALTLRNAPRNFLHDQAGIWTAPLRASQGEAVMGLLLIASAGALGSEDANIMQHHFLDLNTASHASTASTGLVGILGAVPAAYYGFGRMRHNSDMEKTGYLAGEAMADGLAVNEVFKLSSRRERPNVDNARGLFFQPGAGWNSSFASSHSVLAWSSATVLASRSHHLLYKVGLYGMASGVTVARVVGRDHFPSDVYVGSAVGWLIGRYVLHHHATEDE